MSGVEEGVSGLLLQFLSWLETRPRSYAETMEAWRTSCPRLTIWEDAVDQGFVALEHGPETRVVLTAAGRAHLARAVPGRTARLDA